MRIFGGDCNCFHILVGGSCSPSFLRLLDVKNRLQVLDTRFLLQKEGYDDTREHDGSPSESIIWKSLGLRKANVEMILRRDDLLELRKTEQYNIMQGIRRTG